MSGSRTETDSSNSAILAVDTTPNRKRQTIAYYKLLILCIYVCIYLATQNVYMKSIVMLFMNTLNI